MFNCMSGEVQKLAYWVCDSSFLRETFCLHPRAPERDSIGEPQTSFNFGIQNQGCCDRQSFRSNQESNQGFQTQISVCHPLSRRLLSQAGVLSRPVFSCEFSISKRISICTKIINSTLSSEVYYCIPYFCWLDYFSSNLRHHHRRLTTQCARK